MRCILLATILLASFAGASAAETLTGKLVDASCAAAQQATTSCAPTSSTTAFGLVVKGQLYKFDDAGNAKAANALKSQANRDAIPDTPPAADTVNASVQGTREGGMIKVETIEIH